MVGNGYEAYRGLRFCHCWEVFLVITFQELARLNGYDLTTAEGLKHACYLWEEFKANGGNFPKPYEVEDFQDEPPI